MQKQQLRVYWGDSDIRYDCWHQAMKPSLRNDPSPSHNAHTFMPSISPYCAYRNGDCFAVWHSRTMGLFFGKTLSPKQEFSSVLRFCSHVSGPSAASPVSMSSLNISPKMFRKEISMWRWRGSFSSHRVSLFDPTPESPFYEATKLRKMKYGGWGQLGDQVWKTCVSCLLVFHRSLESVIWLCFQDKAPFGEHHSRPCWAASHCPSNLVKLSRSPLSIGLEI